MFENWQVVAGLMAFLTMYLGFYWLAKKRILRLRIRRMEKEVSEAGLRELKINIEIKKYYPNHSIPKEVFPLPQIGEEISFISLRGKGQHRIRQAIVESVRVARNSFVLRWMDSHDRMHRRSMTLAMLRHRLSPD